jgi:low temperature requirement protein LtrA
MELFYDLVFVVAVAQLGNRLGTDHSFAGVLEFVALFLRGPLRYGRLDPPPRDRGDDARRRRDGRSDPHSSRRGSAGFAAAYVCASTVLLLLYLSVRFTIPEARSVTGLYLTGIGAALWAISILTPPPARFVLWALGPAVDFATPWIGRHTGVLRRFPLDTLHLPERFGLFTIIVLGETLLSSCRTETRASTGEESKPSITLAYVENEQLRPNPSSRSLAVSC